jgi:hypothetical protein
MAQPWVTDRIKADVDKQAASNGVGKEALLNVLLRLALSDDRDVMRAVRLIQAANLGGEQDLTNKGW